MTESASHYQPVRVRISLSAKLLATLVVCISIAVIFLGLTATRLFIADKEKSVYDNQMTEAMFAGRELSGRLKTAIDLLRTVAASGPTAAKPIIENQDVLESAEIYQFNPETKVLQLSYSVHRKPDQPSTTDPKLILEYQNQFSELQAKQYLFKNITASPNQPNIGVILVPPNTNPVLMILGTVSMKPYLNGLQNSVNRFTITDEQGNSVLDSDYARLLNKEKLANDSAFLFSKETSVQGGSKKVQDEGLKSYLVSFNKTDLGLIVLVRTEYDKVIQAIYSLIEKVTLFGLSLLAALAIVGTYLFKKMTDPVRELFAATHQVADGNFDVSVHVKSRDEIGALGSAFLFMAAKIKDLILAVIEKTRIDQELKIAVTVQQRLLPKTKIQSQNIRTSAFYQSASECGGDWWGIIEFPEKTVLAIADATGHGVSAALITAAARSAFALFEKAGLENAGQVNCTSVLELTNRAIHASTQGELYMTYFVCVIDHSQKKIEYASAGHNPQYLIKPNASGAPEIQSLGAAGVRIGESRDFNASSFEVATADYVPGSRLILYTDGLPDAVDSEDKAFGKKGLKKSVQTASALNAEGILTLLSKDFNEHVGNKPLIDDVTIVVAEFT